MAIKTNHSIEMLIDANSTVEELLDALTQHQTPESAKISISVQRADRPYESDTSYIEISW